MRLIEKGGLVARLAETPAEVEVALALRARVFRAGGEDRDAQDAFCHHVLVEQEGRARACFRIRRFDSALGIGNSYAAGRYDLAALSNRAGAMAELGRFCAEPGLVDPDVIRLCWAAATRLVLDWGATFLFGCTSFAGTEPQAASEALGFLAAGYLAPPEWAPGRVAPEIFSMKDLVPPRDPLRAAARLPGLLRSYLLMGGRVSDHAVIDRDLGTYHLFTGLDIAAVPAARAAALRDLLR